MFYFKDKNGVCRLFITQPKDTTLTNCKPTEYDKLFNFTYFLKEKPRISINEFKKELSEKLKDPALKLISLGESHNNNAEQETAKEILQVIAKYRKIKEFAKEQASVSVYSTATGETRSGQIDTRVIDPYLNAMGIKIGESGDGGSQYSFCEKAREAVSKLNQNEVTVTYTGFAHSSLVLSKYFHEDVLTSGGKLTSAIKECQERTGKYLSIIFIEEKNLFDGITSRIMLSQPQTSKMSERREFIQNMTNNWKYAIEHYPLTNETYVVKFPLDPDIYFVIVDPGSYYVRAESPILLAFKILFEKEKSVKIFARRPDILKNCCTYTDLKIDEYHSIPLLNEGNITFPIDRYSGRYKPAYTTFYVLNDPGPIGEQYQFEIRTKDNMLNRIKYEKWDVKTGSVIKEEFL